MKIKPTQKNEKKNKREHKRRDQVNSEEGHPRIRKQRDKVKKKKKDFLFLGEKLVLVLKICVAKRMQGKNN